MQILKAAFLGVALIAVPAFAQGDSPVVVEGGVPTAIVSYADKSMRLASNGAIRVAAR